LLRREKLSGRQRLFDNVNPVSHLTTCRSQAGPVLRGHGRAIA
jgi:hypothetical protein